MGEVVNVDGTPFWELPTDGSYPGEFVWNDGIPDGSVGDQASASGGGVSSLWPMPSYQTTAAKSLGVISSDSSQSCGGQFCRQVPDVSADADPNSGYVVFAQGEIWCRRRDQRGGPAVGCVHSAGQRVISLPRADAWL